MVGLDRLTRRVYRAPVTYPAVALYDGPLVQTDPVGRLVELTFERVERELPTGVIEKEVIGLSYVVDAGARGPGLDHVHSNVEA